MRCRTEILCACPKSPPREKSSPLQGEATPFSPSAGCGLLSQSIHVLQRMDHYRKLQRLHLARWRRTLCPPLHESTSLAALLRHFRSVPGRVAAAVTPCPPFRCRCTPDKESRASAPRYFILSPCTPKGGLQAARQILSRSVLHSASTTHPLQVCSDSTSLTLVSVSTGFSLLFRVRSILHTSSEGSQPSETVPFAPVFVPHIVAPVTDSPRGIPIGMDVSGLDAPGMFLDFVPGHGVSAESAEPSGLVILAGSNPAPLHFIKEHPYAGPTLTPEALWPSTAIPPSCKRRSDRCTPLEPHPVRRLPRLSPCLLAFLRLRELSADAATPERAKPPSPPILTHASAYC